MSSGFLLAGPGWTGRLKRGMKLIILDRVMFQCVAPLTYIGQHAVQTDIANIEAARAQVNVEEAYLPAVAPWLEFFDWLGRSELLSPYYRLSDHDAAWADTLQREFLGNPAKLGLLRLLGRLASAG
ncbi:MAG: hypothetical protein ACREOH_21890 [Candidatus Entotheonellia bacterium]